MAKSLGRTLKARRLHLKMLQATVARLSGKGQGYIAKLENGTVDPRLSSVVEVSRALGLEVVLVPVLLVPTVRGIIEESTGARRKLVGNDPEDEEDDDE
jgi:predicted transcriptional regulator